MKKWFLLAMAGALVLAAVMSARFWLADPWPEPFPADPTSTRILPQGQVVGFDAGHGAHGWMGIPFAAAPVGERRWRAPQAATAWAGTLQALQPGPVCPQLGGPLATAPMARFGKVVGEEDCLFLNVWAPRHTPQSVPLGAAAYPVMVWIHGGGNSIGHGADYDGSRLAGEQQLVVVTFNYRLGVLGWFSHPALVTGDTAPEDQSGNFGTLDTIQALNWVQDNIAAFGGDPRRVTVFGESAGGVNVYGLMASPLAAGLFQGAISQSGLVESTGFAAAHTPPDKGGHEASSWVLVNRWLIEQGRAEDTEQAAALQAAMTDAEVRAFLGQLSPEMLLSGFSAPGGMYAVPMLLQDGHVLPGRPLEEVFAVPGAFNAVPLIAGTNRDESRLFMAMDGRYVERRWGVAPRMRNPSEYQLISALLSDNWKLDGVDRPLSQLGQAQSEPVFAYRFDWDETGSNALIDMPSLVGAAHGFELPFVFGDFSSLWGIPLLFTDENRPGREALARAMMSYWAEFAYTGSPGRGRGDDLPDWQPRVPGDGGRQLVLDTPADGGIRMERQMLSLEALHQRFMAVPAWSQDGKACEVYALLFRDTRLWDQDSFEALDPACRTLTP